MLWIFLLEVSRIGVVLYIGGVVIGLLHNICIIGIRSRYMTIFMHDTSIHGNVLQIDKLELNRFVSNGLCCSQHLL